MKVCMDNGENLGYTCKNIFTFYASEIAKNSIVKTFLCKSIQVESNLIVHYKNSR